MCFSRGASITSQVDTDLPKYDRKAWALPNRSSKQEDTKEEVKTFQLDDIVPARGMIIKENGDVILTAYPTPNTTGRTPSNRRSCS